MRTWNRGEGDSRVSREGISAFARPVGFCYGRDSTDHEGQPFVKEAKTSSPKSIFSLPCELFGRTSPNIVTLQTEPR